MKVQHEGIEIDFYDTQVEIIDRVDHTIVYKAIGMGSDRNEYVGGASYTPGEFDGVYDIERAYTEVEQHRRNTLADLAAKAKPGPCIK